jgi:hypothetical protein
MIPAEAVVRVPDGSSRDGKLRACAAPGEDALEVVCYRGRKLDQRTVERLVAFSRRGMLTGHDGRLRVETSMPFAPSLVVGAALTAVLGGSLVRPLTDAVHRILQSIDG